jgi:hypothetical protein
MLHGDKIAFSGIACELKGTSPTPVVLGTAFFKNSQVSLPDSVQQPITAGVWGNSPFKAFSGHLARVWKLCPEQSEQCSVVTFIS